MTIACANGCEAPAQRYVQYYRETAGGSRIYPLGSAGTALVCAACAEAHRAGPEAYEQRLGIRTIAPLRVERPVRRIALGLGGVVAGVVTAAIVASWQLARRRSADAAAS